MFVQAALNLFYYKKQLLRYRGQPACAPRPAHPPGRPMDSLEEKLIEVAREYEATNSSRLDLYQRQLRRVRRRVFLVISGAARRLGRQCE